jgi:hypothetical protein
MYKPIFCLSQNIGQTAIIVSQLKESGFSNNEVSVLFPDNLSTTLPVDDTQDLSDKAANIALNVGVDLEWIVGIGSLEVPGIGRFIAAGPIMFELNRIPEKAAFGELMDALIGVGIPAHQAELYQEKIKTEQALIVVNTASLEERDAANTIFQQAHAEDISSTEESSVVA